MDRSKTPLTVQNKLNGNLYSNKAQLKKLMNLNKLENIRESKDKLFK